MFFSSLSAFRTELAALIKAGAPSEWRIVKDLTAATDLLAPAVYVEFTRVATTGITGPLPRGQVEASADLVVVDPRKADGAAEDAVDDHLADLLTALDASAEVRWTDATKERLEGGQFAWRISTTALVNTKEQ